MESLKCPCIRSWILAISSFVYERKFWTSFDVKIGGNSESLDGPMVEKRLTIFAVGLGSEEVCKIKKTNGIRMKKSTKIIACRK